MFKKREISGWFTVTEIAFAISLVVGAFLYFRLSSAKEVENEFLSIPKCEGDITCRKVVDAVILDAKTMHFITYVPKGRTGRSRKISFSNYLFRVMTEDGNVIEFEVSPKISLYPSDFDYQEVYIPSELYDSFVTDNFHPDTDVRLEIWHGDVTFLITKSVFGYLYTSQPNDIGFYFSLSETGMKESQSEISADVSEERPEIAIPTISHPSVIAKKAEENLQGWIGASVLFIVVVLAFSTSKK